MKTFDFKAQLAMSDTDKVRTLVEKAMRQRFPDLLAIHKAHLENDKRGIDYWLEFPNGIMEKLDVKVRTTDFAARGDGCNVALETVANSTTGKPGWTVDAEKLTDWVLILWLDTGKTDLHHTRHLRAVTEKKKQHWLAHQKVAKQITKTAIGSYESESVFVSSRDIWANVYQEFSYAAKGLEPPASEYPDVGDGWGAA